MHTNTEYERVCRILLAQVIGVGPVMFSYLSDTYGDIFSLYKTLISANSDFSQHPRHTQLILASIQKIFRSTDPFAFVASLESQHIQPFVRGIDPDYPARIGQLKNPPPVIYIRGELPAADAICLAVVGTRRPTSYGITVTQQLVTDLVESGIVIISGLAFGIDGIAHQTVLEHQGQTVGFLASGVDLITPREHESLGQHILAAGGCLISSFRPGETPKKGNFVARNRFVAGYSQGVIIPEGARDSGTVITANYAMAQGKPVFAVPGQITSQMSQAPLDLIKQGAHLVTSAKEIIEVIGHTAAQPIKKNITFETSLQQHIYAELQRETFTADDLARQLNCPITQLTIELSLMELKGIITQQQGKWQIY